MGWNTIRDAARVAVAAALAAALAACGSGAAETGGTSGPPDAPILNLSGIEKIDLGTYRDIGVTENGLYTVTEDAVTGFDPTGARQWTLRKDGMAPDPERVQAVPYEAVLMVGWDEAPGLVAYSTETGEELWSTQAPEWHQVAVTDGRVSFADAYSGRQRWSVELASFGCPVTDDPLAPVWIRDAVLVRCYTAVGADGRGTDQWAGALNPADGTALWQRRLTGSENVAVESRNTLAIEHEGGDTEVVDLTTGTAIARRPAAPGSRYRLPRPDGISLVMDSTTLSDNTEMRLQEADGRVRWTAPLDAAEEVLPLTTVVSGNVILATMQRTSGDRTASLLAYDMTTGARTLVAGPGPSVRDEQPLLRMSVRRQQVRTQSAPWGVLVPDEDGSVAVVPAE
ncbi:PQQ-binding-like beta-propeller repeat protein [Nocardia higoensis]|uniref:PQQ-binding-like beta-propeller repeat protein n=1 Tax=Nocardia higoensis TaxID=228599 RepID=A0ABS0DAP8_9NOCA|nr:PQQ-binding-like beta-propeller repeat protein [Nocardia higoensis]MBF6354707.1 PQQ-binding-like beta-propeller repeat protein [Nocardia higoensis]